MNNKIIKLGHHERVCCISEPPNGELIDKIMWLDDRFMKSIAIELISEATLNIINAFESGEIDSKLAKIQFDLIIHSEKQEKQMKTKAPIPANRREVKNEKKAFKDTEMTVKPVAKDKNKTRRKMKTPMGKKK